MGAGSSERKTPVPSRRRAILKTFAGKWAVLLSLGLTLSACDLFDVLKERLAVLGVSFDFRGLDVSRLAYPTGTDFVSGYLNFLALDSTALKKFGVDIRCDVKASNPNSHRAVFDGAVAHLRVQDTSAASPDLAATISRFSVEGGKDTTLSVTFPLRLNNPIFSKATWGKILNGEDIPYRIDADMFFNLVGPGAYGELDTLGSKSLRLNVVKSSVNAKETSQTILTWFLGLLDLNL